MSRYRITAILALGITSFGLMGAGAEPEARTTNAPGSANEIHQQLLDSQAEIARLQSAVNAYKVTRTGNDLLRLLMTEEQTWEGTVGTRYDSDDEISIGCRDEAGDYKVVLNFALTENPGDLTVGDTIRVKGRVKEINTPSRYGRHVIKLKDVSLIERIRPTSSNTTQTEKK